MTISSVCSQSDRKTGFEDVTSKAFHKLREVKLQDLWRLRGTRQKLVFVPDLQEVIGEKDGQVPAA